MSKLEELRKQRTSIDGQIKEEEKRRAQSWIRSAPSLMSRFQPCFPSSSTPVHPVLTKIHVMGFHIRQRDGVAANAC